MLALGASDADSLYILDQNLELIAKHQKRAARLPRAALFIPLTQTQLVPAPIVPQVLAVLVNVFLVLIAVFAVGV